ncbi:hypothetical protein PTTG_11706 [Puccinia triticina 1-1 BBBD Race 1]|uniref:Calpain catalytic domain-containing protein n=2 Tax=Puccinia triticina (isolate 1-1 / race 1 (BBBD)) TaxID=630390 RepID=A0A180H516_PUCT1|nr:hypothetical protein PTTG_11706 [Puccinia triticina 1-1 BBBD Race 1]WAR53115.1 hypothetical protein PtB15_2B546 [Puccinia triticina]
MDLGSLSPELRSKLKEVQTIASRATRQETQGDYEQAFSLYVDSVQKYLFLIRALQDGPLKEQLKAISSKLLKRAELIKSSRPQLSLRAPVRDRTSSEEQDAVLQRSQKINGLSFPPWPPSHSNQMKDPSHQSQLASVQPALSPVQQQAFLEWRSIKEANPDLQVYKADALDPTDIVQDVVTDCSLIAAFSVLINHAKQFQSKLHTECLYPKGPDGSPQASTDGIYRVKLFLNGTKREILVDDKIPIGTSGTSMCAKSRQGLYFWPSLVEKAYMKVMGGYDFVGSNSSVDLHALTGWIPETILLTSQEYRSERSWNRVYSGFSQGHCLVSVGTNGNNLDALENVGLVPFHDYAVIDIRQDTKGNRLVTLYNAWNVVEPQPAPSTQWTTQLENALPKIPISRRPERVGTFTISWESLQMYFETVYLNWDPSPFKFQRMVHFFHHPLPAFEVKFDHGPALESDPEVWILLTRHLDSQVTDNKSYMSLQVFLDDQENTSRAQKNYDSLDHGLPPLTATPLSNSTHLLARFSLPNRRATYLINFSFHDDRETRTQADNSNVVSKPVALTLQIFSPVSISLSDSTPVPLPFSKELEGQWTPKTSGGNHALATYSINPMWRITIEERSSSERNESGKGKFRASLTTIDASGSLDTRKPLNVKLIRSSGDGRVYEVERRDVLADSGSYTLGRAQLRVNQLLPGKYTIVPSTYQAGVIGLFKLQLECDLPLTRVESIPSEGAGMYKRVGCLSWEEEKRRASFWRLTGGKGLVKTKIKLQATHQPGAYPIKLTLIQHESSQDEGKVISPGIFTNALSGAAIGPLQLSFSQNFEYTILVEALGDSCATKGEGYVLTVYADQSLSLDRIAKETR